MGFSGHYTVMEIIPGLANCREAPCLLSYLLAPQLTFFYLSKDIFLTYDLHGATSYTDTHTYTHTTHHSQQPGLYGDSETGELCPVVSEIRWHQQDRQETSRTPGPGIRWTPAAIVATCHCWFAIWVPHGCPAGPLLIGCLWVCK